ncbi:hypothetical protein C440_08127 [Haloferax mucosum ATCC BAA-1512]|uniref:Uncharacterized protein n=1 Tax=Haloferax mucosum ATCC BAA-1512 TaxID=662479 RepID=M0IGS8_9EURY|nr:hypothetical protein [Haloferax mucosum]ELZ95028.1 hypothetical protein C440_08127 [Haloferax mucosum ATCC BAA-1512]
MSDGLDPLTPEQRQEKRESLLRHDYAEECPDCGAVVFEWQDECDDCGSGDGVEETTEQQTLLTDGGTSASAIKSEDDAIHVARAILIRSNKVEDEKPERASKLREIAQRINEKYNL